MIREVVYEESDENIIGDNSGGIVYSGFLPQRRLFVQSVLHLDWCTTTSMSHFNLDMQTIFLDENSGHAL